MRRETNIVLELFPLDVYLFTLRDSLFFFYCFASPLKRDLHADVKFMVSAHCCSNRQIIPNSCGDITGIRQRAR